MLKFVGYGFTENDASSEEKEWRKAFSDFRRYFQRFRELEDNPRKFFSDESRMREVSDISNKLKEFYLGELVRESEHRNSDD